MTDNDGFSETSVALSGGFGSDMLNDSWSLGGGRGGLPESESISSAPYTFMAVKKKLRYNRIVRRKEKDALLNLLFITYSPQLPS